MHDQGQVDQACDSLEAIEVEPRLARELGRSVRGADGDRERVDLCLGREPHRLLRHGERLLDVLVADVLDPRDAAELRLDLHPAGPREGDDLAGRGHVLRHRKQRGVDHDRGVARGDRGPRQLRVLAVVEMECNRDANAARQLGRQRHHRLQADVRHGAAGGLEHDRCAQLLGRPHDRAGRLQVVDVEAAYGPATAAGVLQELARAHQHQCALPAPYRPR